MPELTLAILPAITGLGSLLETLGGASPISSGKDAWDKIQIVGGVSIPILILIVGLLVNSAIRARQRSEKLVELAIGILRSDPEKTPIPGLRHWGADVISKYSGVPLSAEARKEIAESSVTIEAASSLEQRLDRVEDVLLRRGRTEFSTGVTASEIHRWLKSFPPGEFLFPNDDEGFDAPLDYSKRGEIGLLHSIVRVISMAVRHEGLIARGGGQWGGQPVYDECTTTSNEVTILAQCETRFHPKLKEALSTSEEEPGYYPLDPEPVIEALRNLDNTKSRFETNVYRLNLAIIQDGESREIIHVYSKYMRLGADAARDKGSN